MIVAILPCRGRKDQTVRNVKRLLSTAGRVEWSLTCIGGEDETDVLMACSAAGAKVRHILERPRLGYWEALAEETALTDAPFLVNLANDLLPGRDWLSRAFAEYRCCFGTRDALIGFNDGIHGEGLSPHMLISRGLLNSLGGWPVWYQHEYGDAELCARAQALGVYSKAAWACLYHDHPFVGGETDSVYEEGHASRDQDAALFAARRRGGMAARLSIIVPTHDGEGLETLFASVADQLLPDFHDEVLIIGDTHEGSLLNVELRVRTKGYRYLPFDAGHHCWGHCQINYGITQATGDYLIFIDDDDCVPDGALDSIRRAIAEQPAPRPLMFKFWSRRHDRELPPGHYVQESAIGGHAMVVPNIPERLGTWGERYAGDYDWIESTLAHWPDGPAWYDDVIACA